MVPPPGPNKTKSSKACIFNQRDSQQSPVRQRGASALQMQALGEPALQPPDSRKDGRCVPILGCPQRSFGRTSRQEGGADLEHIAAFQIGAGVEMMD